MYEILNSLKEKLNLEYIGVMGEDGFSVYEIKESFENAEEKIAEISEILLSEVRFSKETMKSNLKSSYIELENGLNIYLCYLSGGYFLVGIFNDTIPFGKVKFFFTKNREKIIEKL